jgi:hypothetical protein
VAPFRLIDRLDSAARDIAGIVDQDVDLGAFGGQAAQRGAISQIHRMHRHVAAELRFRLVEARAVAGREVDAAALGDEGFRGRKADAFRAACDQNRLALQPQIHDFPKGVLDVPPIIGARRKHP